MIPSTAAYIWLRDGVLHLGLPSTLPDGHPHSLTFPNDPTGRARIFAILAEREHSPDLRLALRGSPTQAQLAQYDEAKIKRPGRPKAKLAPGVAEAAKEVMRKLGML